MNKKVIAAAIAAAVVAAPAAYAEAVLYGKLHTSIDIDDFSLSTDSDENFGFDGPQMNSRASRIGVKGSEDLGNGLKAIYQFETTILSDGGNEQNVTTGFGSQRNTFVGLAGGWGTFLLGRHDTPAKVAFYGTGTEYIGDSILDLNGNPFDDRKGAPTGVFSEVRANNTITYISPTFAGFTFLGSIIPGEEDEVENGNQSDGWTDHYSVGAIFKGLGGLKVGVGYEKLDNQAYGAPPEAENDDSKMWQAGASYTFFDNFTIGGNYESTDNYKGVDGDDYTAWGVTGKIGLGNNAITAQYVDAELDPDGSSKTDYDAWGVGAEHNFSKRTKVYAAYASGDSDDVDQDSFSLGMIHNF
jgi:predicted porin